MMLINGEMPIIGGLSEAQTACIDLLEETVEMAREGKITSVAIIACLDGGYASVMAGKAAADLNLGCDSLKRKILEAVEGGNVARPSKLVRAR